MTNIFNDDLAATMVDWHLETATHWLLRRAEQMTLDERDYLVREFKSKLNTELLKIGRVTAQWATEERRKRATTTEQGELFATETAFVG